MIRWVTGGAAVLGVLLTIAFDAHAERVDLEAALARGGLSIPIEWAGVWSFTDTSYACATPGEFVVETGVDTICAGTTFEPDAGVEFECFGSVSATVIDVTCTATVTLDDCTVILEHRTQATRTGETMRLVFTTRESFTPVGCGAFPDRCSQTRGRATRTAPQPAACTSAGEGGTWTGVKQLYR